MRTLHLFRGGTQRAHSGTEVEFSEADLAGVAESYDPALHEAPLVVGHPTLNAPAWGWVSSLSTDGADLYGEPAQVAPEFSEAVEAGRYKKISASFYLPSSPNHPVRLSGGEPEAPYLRHVGFLGAMPPAVKGLGAVAFGEHDEGIATLELDFAEASTWSVRALARMLRGVRSWIADRDGDEAAEGVIPESALDYALDSLARAEGRAEAQDSPRFAEADAEADRLPPTPPSMSKPDAPDTTPEFAEREAALATREAELAAREQKIRDGEAAAQRKGHLDFAESLAADGARILPRHVPVVAGVLDRLAGVAEADTVSFGETDVDHADALRQMLGELPQNVDFGEVTAPEPGGDGQVVDFAAPAGFTVDAGQAALHAKAKRYAAEHDVDFVLAVQAVSN